MKIKIMKRYYKRSRPGEEPIRYKAVQPKGIGTTIHARIYMDPVLKGHKDLRKALLTHEKREIKTWGKGLTGIHRAAKIREPKITREIGGVSGFWKEIKRRRKL